MGGVYHEQKPPIEYLMTVHNLKHTKWKNVFNTACKRGQFDVVELIQVFINS